MFYRFKNIDFNEEVWLKHREKRFLMVSSIVRDKLLLGLSKKEIIKLLGFEFNDIHSNVWTYYIGKKHFFCIKRKLYIYFNDNDKVYNSKKSS